MDAEKTDLTSNENLLDDRELIVVSNRGPVEFIEESDGTIKTQKSGGGLATALAGMAQNIEIAWIAAASNDLEKAWGRKEFPINENGCPVDLHLIPMDQETYEGYYDVISNPLLWFLQHSMWNYVTAPTITKSTWKAWEDGYVKANQEFAKVVFQHIKESPHGKIVMIQDYHLYLLPRMLRQLMRPAYSYRNVTITHFVHIPWPGPEDLRMLPPRMRQSILDGLIATDLLGFQTDGDCLNFLRCVESHLPGVNANYKRRRIWYHNHACHLHDFPISIDVDAIKILSESDEVKFYQSEFKEIIKDQKMILRVDRTEPSKNIVRGFEAFGEMLELHPEHLGKVKFIALLVPSRLDVEEYHTYHDQMMAAAGWVNSRFSSGNWEPIRVILGENYARAVAALKMYDVLLVNSIADGMNLVAKEGAVVNQNNGILVLSERTGASQQLAPGSLVISPCDVYATAEALHQALTTHESERQTSANRLRWLVEENDINAWLNDQLSVIKRLRN